MATTPRELDITLDRGSPVPLYHQLARSIEQAIADGTLVAGDRLENELSLTSRLALSRPTARQAIQELVRKGLVVRKRGSGTQVVGSPRFHRDERLSSLYEDLLAAGRTPSTKLLAYGWVDTAEALAGLDLEVPDPRLLRIQRLRLVDGVPLAVLTNHLPARLELSAAALETRGLYQCLRALGVNLRIAHQRIGARLLDAAEAALLDRELPAAALTATRIAYDDAGRFVEAGQHVYCAEEYVVQTTLVT